MSLLSTNYYLVAVETTKQGTREELVYIDFDGMKVQSSQLNRQQFVGAFRRRAGSLFHMTVGDALTVWHVVSERSKGEIIYSGALTKHDLA